MNKLGALLVIGASVVGPCLPLDAVVAATLQSRTEAASTADRYIVEFDAGTDPDVDAAQLSGLGVEVVDLYRSVFPGASVRVGPDLIDQVREAGRVMHVEAGSVISVGAIPPIVQSAPTWGLDRIDQRTLPLSKLPLQLLGSV